ncbi:MAG: hypothetical protein ABH840_00935 [Nanoarchaeota archaeon]
MSKKRKLEYADMELNFDDPTHEETLEHQRMADDIMLQRRAEEYVAEERSREMKAKYKSFRRDVESQGVSLHVLRQTEVKKNLLESYFPGQFSKQDLSKHTPAQIGKVFARIYSYSKGYT